MMTPPNTGAYVLSDSRLLRTPLAAVLVLLAALILFISPLREFRLTTIDNAPGFQPTLLESLDRVDSESSNVASLYSALRTTWQKILGSTIQAERILSMWLWALSLACVYRLTRDQFSSRVAYFSTLAVYPIGLAFMPLGWLSYFSWLSLLTIGSMCLLIRLKGPGRYCSGSLFTWILYGVSVAILLISYRGLWIVLCLHAIYGVVSILVGRRHLRLWLLGIGLGGFLVGIGYAVLGYRQSPPLPALLEQTFSLPNFWQSFVNWVDYNPPVLSIGLAIGANLGLAVTLFDQRSRQFALATVTRFLFVGWITLGLVAAFLSKQWAFAALVSLALPVTIGLIKTYTFLSWRSRLVGGLLGFILFFSPYFPPDSINWLQQQIYSQYIPGTPVIVSLYHTGPLTADFAQLHRLGWSPIYYVVSREQALTFDVHGLPRLESITGNWPSNTKELWLIEASKPVAEAVIDSDTFSKGKEPLEQQTENGIALSIYFARPTHEAIYHFGQLALLEFDIQGGNTVAPVSTLILNSWWTLDELVKDNYIWRLSLLDADGQPRAGDEGLLGTSVTGSWAKNSLHFDRRVLQLPANLPHGNYNLVASVHGAQYDTHNLPVSLNDKSVIGEYAYLTTITVGEVHQ